MDIPPGINAATRLEESRKCGGALSPGVRRLRARTIKIAVKDRVKVTAKKCRNGGINLISQLLKELVPYRVAVGSIQQNNTKGLVTKGKLALQQTPFLICPRLDQRQWDERGQHNHKISWSQEKQHLENQKNETTNHIQPEKHSEIPGYRQHQRQQVENATTARNQHVYRPYAGGWR